MNEFDAEKEWELIKLTHPSYHRFKVYHEEHPETYAFFVYMARAAKARGYSHCSIKHLIEVGRWEKGRDFRIASGFSHNFQSLYARLIMLQEADLKDFFETRDLISLRWRGEAAAA